MLDQVTDHPLVIIFQHFFAIDGESAFLTLRTAAFARSEKLVAVDGNDFEIIAISESLVAFEAVVNLYQDLPEAIRVRQGIDTSEGIDAGRMRADHATQTLGKVPEVFFQAVQAGAVAGEQRKDAGQDSRARQLRFLA